MSQPMAQDESQLFLIIIAVLMPWAAVLVMKGCNQETLICVLLTCLFYIPGLLYALYLIFNSNPENNYFQINRNPNAAQPQMEQAQQFENQHGSTQAYQDKARPVPPPPASAPAKHDVESLNSEPNAAIEEKLHHEDKQAL